MRHDPASSPDRSHTPAPEDGQRPVIALARPEARDSAAILRALALSVARRVPLRVVFCLPPRRATSTVLFPERVMEGLRGGLGDTRRVRAATAWLARIAPSAEVRTARGSVMAIAHDVGRTSDLLVLSSKDVEHPHDAIWLATELDVPVLVARPPRQAGAFVAATRFDRPDLPVLTRAGELARATEMPLVAVHNAELCVIQPLTPEGAPRVVGPTASELREIGKRLASAAERIEPAAQTVVATEPSTTRAVLDAAKRLGADLIAVGATRRKWWSAAFGRGVAESIVRGASASVLVTPLPH